MAHGRRSLRTLLVWVAFAALAAACAPSAGDDAGSPDVDAGLSPRQPLVCEALPAGVAAGQVGEQADVVTSPARSVVLMGGGPEVDDAMRAFVEAAGGGDVLVLRASGSTESYLPYLASELSPSPAPSSVTVLRVDDDSKSGSGAVTCRVQASEAVWLAGGDQSAYLLRWQGALHEQLAATSSRDAAIGGTSAGAMSLGEIAFDAALGSVTSEEALLSPTDALVSVSPSPFAQAELRGFVVDTHFSTREREGRLLAFLAHARLRHGVETALGLGLDEETALVIEGDEASVHSAAGGAVWLYRFAGAATLDDGAPLEMDVVERARLDDGDRVRWPPAWEALPRSELAVAGGVVELR